ncbi:MAG: amphi-Trp domain-containing protein, partial [Halobacteria archaeon]
MTEEVLFKWEGHRAKAEIAEYLRSVARALDEKEGVKLTHGEDSIELDIPENPEFEVKAEREEEGDETELSVEFEIEW